KPICLMPKFCAGSALGCFRVEKTVEVHDEVARLCLIDGLLGLGLPGHMRAAVVGEDPDDVELRQILEGDAVERGEFATEDEMEKLLLIGFRAHRYLLRGLAPPP